VFEEVYSDNKNSSKKHVCEMHLLDKVQNLNPFIPLTPNTANVIQLGASLKTENNTFSDHAHFKLPMHEIVPGVCDRICYELTAV
jgi:hypothetical protein